MKYYLIITIILLSSCNSNLTFDSNRWLTNENAYRVQLVNSTDLNELFNEVTLDYFVSMLGKPDGFFKSDNFEVKSYEILIKKENESKVYEEYIQLFFNMNKKLEKIEHHGWSKDKNYFRINTFVLK